MEILSKERLGVRGKENHRKIRQLLRPEMEVSNPREKPKNSGIRIGGLKVQKVTVSKDGVILALQHDLRITEEKGEDELILLLGVVFFHSQRKN